MAAGLSGLFLLLLHRFMNVSYYWVFVFFAAIFAGLFFAHRVWKLKESGIAQLLDQTYPELQESSVLLLRPFSSLTLLETWQYKRTTENLLKISAPLQISKKLITPFLIIIACLLAAFALRYLPAGSIDFAQRGGMPPVHTNQPEKLLPEVAGITVTIQPPGYTRKNERRQHAFNVTAEETAVVNWQLQTNKTAEKVIFIFNDTLRLALHSAGPAATSWQLTKQIDSASFYQVSIDGKLSDFYKIETIKDAAPLITVTSPRQYTTIDIGARQQVKLATAISDDYGIADAFVTATIASGNGEAVKFKEQKIPLTGFIAGKSGYHLQQWLLLTSLGMQPGDELYFYIQATDNHLQQNRSDIYIVHMPDTAQLMSLEGLANSLSLKPEYFRSQRQIIIETEQLLRDKDTISQEAFKNRSNNLGIDQKLLRLRYSKFLGDETEPGEINIDEVAGISDFSNAEKVKDAFTDKHDNAEDASFFEPGTKKQLQATLAEMWKSEMRLRTFTPQAALPFEYKALRLLKDLQQQSRVYVAKTNFKTTPLDLTKRLTGDLSKIEVPLLQKNNKEGKDPQTAVRAALAALEAVKAGDTVQAPLNILQQATLQLHQNAARQPGVYLPAVEAVKKIISHIETNNPIAGNDILAAELGLQQLLRVPDHSPVPVSSHAARLLSRQYFENLQKRQP
jgi:hypothetical protein